MSNRPIDNVDPRMVSFAEQLYADAKNNVRQLVSCLIEDIKSRDTDQLGHDDSLFFFSTVESMRAIAEQEPEFISTVCAAALYMLARTSKEL